MDGISDRPENRGIAAPISIAESASNTNQNQPSSIRPPPLPLHKCITLPFALHVEPLPSLHYQGVPISHSPEDISNDEAADLEEEDKIGYEQPHSAIIGNSVRLQPLVLQPPPHDLDTISFLLEHSRAMEAVHHLVQLIRLLHSADDDPNFINLINFFDTRFDLNTGRLVGDNTTQEDVSIDGAYTRRASKLARIVSRRSHKSRTASSSGDSPVQRSGSMSLGQSGSILSTSSETDESALNVEEDFTVKWPLLQSPPSSFVRGGPSSLGAVQERKPAPRHAPHLLVALKSDPSKYRSVVFPVRLDLHNAGQGLCPHPPTPAGKIWGTRPQGMDFTFHKDDDPMTQGTDGDAGSSTGLTSGLHRILTPDSACSDRSNLSSSQSGSDRFDYSMDLRDPCPRKGSGAARRRSGRTLAVQEAPAVGSTVENSVRRPSALQHFLRRRKTYMREASANSDSNALELGTEIKEEEKSGMTQPGSSGMVVVKENLLNPSKADEYSLPTAFAAGIAIHESSPGLGFIPPGLLAVESNTSPDTSFPHEESDNLVAPSASWADATSDDSREPIPDFLAVLRSAAETALGLPFPSPQKASNLSEKGQGKQPCSPRPLSRSSCLGTPDSNLTSPRPCSATSLCADKDINQNVFLRAERAEADEEEEAWYPSGSNDPLPVAISAALAPALGWDGVMHLCYGSGSPAAQSGQLAPLARAAALASQNSGKTGEGKSNGASSRRTLADWRRLFHSIGRWVELYEITRVRGGLARETGLDPPLSDLRDQSASPRAQYSLTSGIIPAEVVDDASNRAHTYRRRLGIPEGLPATEDGIELGDYRWSRQRLGPASVATAMTLTAASLAHFFTASADTSFTFQAAWELDYLEAQVLQMPVIAERFPPPMYQAVLALSHPFDSSEESQKVAKKHAQPCPNPKPDGSFDVDSWHHWLSSALTPRSIVTPAVSVQAWWTIIAILNGGGPAGVDLQILGKDENWRDVDADFDEGAAVHGFPVYV